MSLYYQDEHVTLYHGSFVDILPEIDALPDVIVADPPYGETSLEWDVWPKHWPGFMSHYTDSMWCFGSMRMFLEHGPEFSDYWKLSQDIIWQKNRGSGFATDRFARIHEHALHWYRGDWGSIYHETPRVPRTGPEKAVTRRTSSPHTGKISNDVPYVDDGFRLHPSVIDRKSVV